MIRAGAEPSKELHAPAPVGRLSALLTARTGAPLALGVLVFLLYAVTHSQNYTGDSLVVAREVEGSSLRPVLIPHRMLVVPLCTGFYRVWQLFGWSGRALFPLQILSALCGGLSTVLIFLISRRLCDSSRAAWLAALGFACCGAVWLFSTDAEAVTLPLLMTLLLLYRVLAVAPETTRRPGYAVTLGVGTGLALLTYLTNGLLVPVFAVSFLLAERQARAARLRQALIFVVAAGLTALPVYLFVMYAVFGVHDWQALREWDLYGGPGERSSLYNSFDPLKIPHAGYAFIRSLMPFDGLGTEDHTRAYLQDASWSQRAVFGAYYGLALAAVLATLRRAKAAGQRLLRARRVALGVLVTWALLNTAFALYWVVGDLQFWVPIMVPWWLLWGVAQAESGPETPSDQLDGASQLRRASVGQQAAAIGFLTFLFIGNAVQMMTLNRITEPNRELVLATSVAERAAPADLIITPSPWRLVIYLQYFAGRPIVVLPSALRSRDGRLAQLQTAELSRRIGATIGNQGHVYLVGFASDPWAAFSAEAGLPPDGPGGLRTRPAWSAADEQIFELVSG